MFISELESALLSGEIDLAVHSAKDLPLELAEGLEISAVLKEEIIEMFWLQRIIHQ